VNIKELLEKVKSGETGIDEAAFVLSQAPFVDLGFAKLDTHRKIRTGAGEVIYGEGKTAAQIKKIAETLLEHGGENIMITRINGEKYSEMNFPDAVFHETARVAVINPRLLPANNKKYIAVVSAGTSDIPVAEEAAVVAETLGNSVKRIYDAGVAGLHRLLAHLDEIQGANCVIAVAGMEGALASVVAGLVSRPVIAVPTSVGYGANFGGVSALLAMLNSCAAGVSVVNIDNGFGAGYLAGMINRGLSE
jgi:NCAIR mutase (PurE)-related protein